MIQLRKVESPIMQLQTEKTPKDTHQGAGAPKNHLEINVKISVAIQQGKEVRNAIITLTKKSNAEYVFKRLFESGWLVVETKKVA